jgi:hypothetical protein
MKEQIALCTMHTLSLAPFSAPAEGHIQLASLSDARFPKTGAYSVQVWFFQEQGSDVLKGELPFIVLPEGSEP